VLNSESGWKALSGTDDFQNLSTSMEPQCQLAFDLLVDRLVGYIGSYYVKLAGECDALVFSGGIGERSVCLRRAVIEACQCLGFFLDDNKNESCDDASHPVVEIGIEEVTQKVLVCRTDEQVREINPSLRRPPDAAFRGPLC
jgi:acetate kinase